MRKSVLSIFLAITMLASFMPAAVLAEDDIINETDGFTTDEYVTDEEVEYGITGEVDDYDISDIKMTSDATGFEIYYSAIEDCYLSLFFFEEDSGDIFYSITENVLASENRVTISYDMNNLTQYYIITGVLRNEYGDTLSDTYEYYEGTKEFEEFLNTNIDDFEFCDNVIIDYGQGDEGRENFAVISDDVKVIEVETITDVEIDETADEDTAELFDVGVISDDSYTFNTSNENVKKAIEDVSVGDKVLILPKDDTSEIRGFIVSDIESTVELFDNGDSNSTVTLSCDSDGEVESEDFFDFIRIEETIEVDAGNFELDDSEINEDVEMDEEVELFADYVTGGTDGIQTFNKTVKSLTKTLYNSKGSKIGSITDKISVSGSVYIFVYYKKNWASLPKLRTIQVTALSTLDFTNDFTFSLNKNASYSKDLFSGSITVYSAGVLAVKIPVTGKFCCSAEATVTANTTQKAGIYLGAVYKDKKLSFTKKQREFTKGYQIQVQGNIEVKLGVETGVSCEVGLSKVSARVKLTGECGVKLVGTPTLLENTSTVTHNCTFCLGGTLSIYYGLFQASIDGKENSGSWTNFAATSKTKEYTKKLTSFYASLRSSKWSFGTGSCDNKSYLTTVTVKNSSGNALSGVTVKDGSTTLGKTNSKGQLSKKLSVGSHTLKCSLSGYTSKSTTVKISSSTVSTTVKLTKKSGANETYYTIDDLVDTTVEDYAEFIADAEAVANTIFQIRSAEDLQKLSEFVNTTGSDTTGLRFVLNNSASTIDLTDIDISPIGTENNPFKGEFDGNKFIITGLTISGNGEYSGLFGKISGAKIFDLGIVDASVSGGENVGIIAGYADSESEIYDCYASGTVSGTRNVGGLLGTLSESSVINCYNRADVSGSDNVGGIVGSFTHNKTMGQISNVYSTGVLTSDANYGGIAGMISYATTIEDTSDSEDESEDETVKIVGIKYSYFLNASDAVGEENDYDYEIIAYPVTEGQANGSENTTTISDEDGYALVYSLLDALNNWYSAFSYGEDDTVEDDTTEDATEVASDDNADSDVSVDDTDEDDDIIAYVPYNKWYADESLTNDGYPTFEEKDTVYELTVDYVYEDGTMAKPSVTLYLTEGQSYDVDSYDIEGYYTDITEYSGVMPEGDVNFKVMYFKVAEYTDSALNLYNNYINNQQNAVDGDVYSVNNSDDLSALSAYVNAGGNTTSVSFVQTDDIDASDVEMLPIGSSANSFAGNYDGQYYSISDLTVNGLENGTGLFGNINGSTICNVLLDSVNISGTDYVGGLVGCAYASTIDRCEVSGTVNGNNYVGAIIAKLEDSVVINSCNTANIIGNSNVGGIAGAALSGKILNNYNQGDVGTENSTVVGGIVAVVETAVVENNYNTGLISGESIVGGIAGITSSSLSQCYYLMNSCNEAFGSNTSEYCDTFDDETAATTLFDSLSEWVNEQASTTYVVWCLEDTYPTLGTTYDGWISDITIENSKVQFLFNADANLIGTMYLAVYDGNGELLDLRTYTDSGTYSLDVEEAAAEIKAFLWDEDMVPLENSISRTL